MTQDEKELLTKVLCEQMPYGVKYKDSHGYKEILNMWSPGFHTALNTILYDGRPSLYLRPLSSMTEEEMEELKKLRSGLLWRKDVLRDTVLDIWYSTDAFDYLNAKHFDVRGLIPMGLAIAAVGRDNPYNEKGGEE